MRDGASGARHSRRAREGHGRRQARTGRLSGSAALLTLLVLQLSLVACGDGGSGPAPGEEGTVSRETFVSTYVDLRLAALRDTAASIDAEERERVLRAHGVTREELLRFVEVHGERAEFMQDLWNEVDERIRRAREAGDSTSG